MTQGTLEVTSHLEISHSSVCRAQQTANCAHTSLGRSASGSDTLFRIHIGVFTQFRRWGRFYRHVLIEGNYPHHGAVAFGNHGKALFEVFKYIGVQLRRSDITSRQAYVIRQRIRGNKENFKKDINHQENPKGQFPSFESCHFFNKNKEGNVMLYIGVDLGTSAVKLLLMDENGVPAKSCQKEYPLYFPHPGWSEQDPKDWFYTVLWRIRN